MIEAVEYLRLSVEDGDDESSSITNQRKILDSFAKDNGIIIKDYYIDDGFSGYTMNRPSFNRLKKDLNNNLVDTIKTDLKGMMEFIPSKHCYHTTAPIEDIRASLISNIVVGVKECFDNNSDTLADTNKEGHDTINIVGGSARWLHPNYDKFGLVSKINDWIESIKDNGDKYLF